MIEVVDLDFSYSSGRPLFSHFNWRVDTAQVWAVIGPSGCGKSTLLYLLAGLRHPDGGAVTVRGQTLRRPRPQTGLILQDYGLLPWETVRSNVELGLRIRRFYGPDGTHSPTDFDPVIEKDRSAYWLDRLGIADQAGKFPGQISGGQRQRTAIARTLVLEPDLLLMDEPFSSLDAPTREDLQNLVVGLQRETGMFVIIVTHSIEEAVFMGDALLVLQEPPNSKTRIINNPLAGQPDFRNSPAFYEHASAVRALMGLSG